MIILESWYLFSGNSQVMKSIAISWWANVPPPFPCFETIPCSEVFSIHTFAVIVNDGSFVLAISLFASSSSNRRLCSFSHRQSSSNVFTSRSQAWITQLGFLLFFFLAISVSEYKFSSLYQRCSRSISTRAYGSFVSNNLHISFWLYSLKSLCFTHIIEFIYKPKNIDVSPTRAKNCLKLV